MKSLVIIPTYNEASNILETITQVLKTNGSLEILVVDDRSSDGTAEIVDKFAEYEPRVFLLSRSKKQGLGLAYLAGFQWALLRQYEFVIEMDADGSHQATDLPSLLAATADADLVIGSRWIPGGTVLNWPWSRMLISKLGNKYAKALLGTGIYDMTSGFRVFRSTFLRELLTGKVSSHGYSFQVELAHRGWQQGRVVERPITFIERSSGESKMTLAIVLEALAKVTFWGIRRIF